MKLETEQALSAKFESELEEEALQYRQSVDRTAECLLRGKEEAMKAEQEEFERASQQRVQDAEDRMIEWKREQQLGLMIHERQLKEYEHHMIKPAVETDERLAKQMADITKREMELVKEREISECGCGGNFPVYGNARGDRRRYLGAICCRWEIVLRWSCAAASLCIRCGTP